MAKHSIPAVLLSGGRSSRMGSDKNLLDYGQGPHWQVMQHQLLAQFDEVWISCREDQISIFSGAANLIIDRCENIGPISGITSSLQKLQADSVFFVSCDLPFYNTGIADKLIPANDQNVIACCAQAEGSDRLEPLVAVWNKLALPHLLKAIEQERYSLQRILKASLHKTLEVEERWLFNANTKEEYYKAK